MRVAKLIAFISILIFLCFIVISALEGSYGWIPDIAFFIVLTLIYCKFYKTLNLNPLIFISLILAHILHSCGVLGWYNISPIAIQWDHITHVFGAFAVALFFWACTSRWMDKKIFTKKNVVIYTLIFFAAFGAGALVELTEFLGYLKLGFGDHGTLFFGAGDADTKLMNVVGGGWINEGWDFVYNTIGILTGMAMMFSLNLIKRIFKK